VQSFPEVGAGPGFVDLRVPEGSLQATPTSPQQTFPYSGEMFWFSRKKLSGSYFVLRAFSRPYFSAP
jgi:hypothetical protein